MPFDAVFRNGGIAHGQPIRVDFSSWLSEYINEFSQKPRSSLSRSPVVLSINRSIGSSIAARLPTSITFSLLRNILLAHHGIRRVLVAQFSSMSVLRYRSTAEDTYMIISFGTLISDEIELLTSDWRAVETLAASRLRIFTSPAHSRWANFHVLG